MIDAAVVAATAAWTQSDKMTYWIIFGGAFWSPQPSRNQTTFLFLKFISVSHIVLMKSQRS